MKIGVLTETADGERRVALTPDVAAKLVGSGLDVLVQAGAGDGSFHSDSEYQEAGATIVDAAAKLLGEADVVLKVQKPTTEEVEQMREGAGLISFLYPSSNVDLVKLLAERRITSFSLDSIPRVARAQSMDALSSMSSIAGYEAVLIGAGVLGKYLPLMTTAAGTVPPARVLVLGAGVAGLQAIATARRLGAVVEAYDVRPAVKEQVESLGAKFIEVAEVEEAESAGGYARQLDQDTQQRQRELLQPHLHAADIVITTALVPGRPAPVLLTKESVSEMRAGSVIVDIAAEAGGNCELTEPGKQVIREGVIICGPLNLASELPVHASQLYARNVSNLLQHLLKDGEIVVDLDDSITGGCCITHEGAVIHEATKALVS